MYIVTAKEMYELDRVAINEGGIDEKILMENAGRAISEKVSPFLGKGQHILVIVGGGNNGGDGFVIARTLLNEGFNLTVLQLVPEDKIKGAAAYHKQLYKNYGGYIHRGLTSDKMVNLIANADIIIDAILGIGISGRLRPPFERVVGEINRSNALVFSVDIPSGVPADEGIPSFTGVFADYTFVIEAAKLSAFLEHTAQYYGKWEVVSIGLPETKLRMIASRRTWDQVSVVDTLPKRGAFSHKGNHGKGLVVGGSREMPGSVAMTALSSLRTGAGLLTVGTVSEAIPSIVSHCTESTFISLGGEEGVITPCNSLDLSSYDAIAIGMGMGRKEKTAQFTRELIQKNKTPILIDADGLHHIKNHLSMLSDRSSPTVLTPHPGELSALIGISVSEILLNPFTIAKEFSIRYGVYLVLKGAFTIVTDPKGNQVVNTSGNAGLAKGGSGDVLSGILLTMMMQSKSMIEGLANGVYIHGKSADEMVVTSHSKRDLLATDCIQGLASVFRTFDNL